MECNRETGEGEIRLPSWANFGGKIEPAPNEEELTLTISGRTIGDMNKPVIHIRTHTGKKHLSNLD